MGEPVQPVQPAKNSALLVLQFLHKRKVHMTLTQTEHAEALAIAADIRRRPAYSLARVYLERLLEYSSRPRTRGLLVGVETVAILVRASFKDRARGRPTITAALADRDLGEAVLLALHDTGFEVADRPQRWSPGRHLACNVRESALWGWVR